MNASPAAPGSASGARDAFDRWWLVVANLLVANAASLHVGPGGLRTPSPAVNLWVSALVLSAPVLRWAVRRRVLRRIPLPGKSTIENVWLVVLLGVLGAAIFVPVVTIAIGIPAAVALGVLVGLLRVSPFPAFWLYVLATLVVVLFVDALPRSPRDSRLLRVVRAVAHAPPAGLLAVVLLFALIDRSAWVGGRDSMFEPVARIDTGSKSYVAVRSDPMAFTRPVLRILVATPLIPGVIGWWHEMGGVWNAATAVLRIEGDELVVAHPASRPGGDHEPTSQRRFSIR